MTTIILKDFLPKKIPRCPKNENPIKFLVQNNEKCIQHSQNCDAKKIIDDNVAEFDLYNSGDVITKFKLNTDQAITEVIIGSFVVKTTSLNKFYINIPCISLGFHSRKVRVKTKNPNDVKLKVNSLYFDNLERRCIGMASYLVLDYGYVSSGCLTPI